MFRTFESPVITAKSSGRPPSTSHAELEHIGVRLFVEQGYDRTSVDDIAAAAGIGRRTFFRYYAAKADVAWGDFEAAVDRLRGRLAAVPDDVPMMEALRTAVVEFNEVPADQLAWHRQRLSLILGVPSLQAHSTLRFVSWREAIAEFAARRLDATPSDLIPHAIGHCALGTAVAAYEEWLADESADLSVLLDTAFHALAHGFDADRLAGLSRGSDKVTPA